MSECSLNVQSRIIMKLGGCQCVQFCIYLYNDMSPWFVTEVGVRVDAEVAKT
jgi:hypothetical protein